MTTEEKGGYYHCPYLRRSPFLEYFDSYLNYEDRLQREKIFFYTRNIFNTLIRTTPTEKCNNIQMNYDRFRVTAYTESFELLIEELAEQRSDQERQKISPQFSLLMSPRRILLIGYNNDTYPFTAIGPSITNSVSSSYAEQSFLSTPEDVGGFLVEDFPNEFLGVLEGKVYEVMNLVQSDSLPLHLLQQAA